MGLHVGTDHQLLGLERVERDAERIGVKAVPSNLALAHLDAHRQADADMHPQALKLILLDFDFGQFHFAGAADLRVTVQVQRGVVDHIQFDTHTLSSLIGRRCRSG